MAGEEYPDLDDDELVDRANRGDELAFEAIYRRYRDWAAHVASRFTAERDEVADVLQDAFAYLFDKFPGFRLTGTIKGLLYPTIRHLCFDRHRRRRPTEPLDTVCEIHLAAAGEASDSGMWRAMARLPAINREILLLRYADDMSLGQIAEALEIPLGTAKSRLHNAIEALRQELAEKNSSAE